MAVLESASASSSVRTWIDRVEVDDVPADRRTFVRVPDTGTALVFRTTEERRSDLMVIGPRTRGSYHPAKKLPVCIRLRVRPEWSRTLLGVDVRDLVDHAVPLSDLWGTEADRLAGEMAGAGDRVFARLASALRDRGGAEPVSPARSRLLSSAMSALAPGALGLGVVSGGRTPSSMSGPALGRDGVGLVAERLGVSERHLRNVFLREVGLSPKHFARIARLRHVLSLAGRRQWASVAGDAGFFDQAHMIADFRALMGVSPGAYLAGRLPTPSACS